MSHDVVNEKSRCVIRARFYDENDANVAPLTARYLLKDVSNDRTVIDWTVITAAASLDIEITAANNAIYDTCRDSEERVLSVQANYDATNQFTDEFYYVIRNLKGFQS